MRKMALLIAAVLVSGCSSDVPGPQETAQDQRYCQSMAKPLTDAYVNCMVSRDQLRVASIQRRRDRSMALMQLGANINQMNQQQAQMNAMNRPVNTTCTKQGVFVNCTTY